MEEKTTQRGRPKGRKRSSKKIMELTRKIVNEYKPYFPEHYSSYIISELEKMNYPLEGVQLVRKIQGVMSGNIGDGLIALAIKRIGKKFKEAEENLIKELQD